MHPTAVMATEGPESSAIHPHVEPRALAARSDQSFIVVVAVSAIAACSPANEVGDATLRMADADTANWLTHGRTYSEQRHSPLRQINDTSVTRLGLAWSVDMQTLHGLEATPLVKDGVMYLTSTWSVVYALDARTGKPDASFGNNGRVDLRNGLGRDVTGLTITASTAGIESTAKTRSVASITTKASSSGVAIMRPSSLARNLPPCRSLVTG